MAGVWFLPAGLPFWIVYFHWVLPGIENIRYQNSFPDFFVNNFVIAPDDIPVTFPHIFE
jgi:hypothetical protein